GEAEGGGPVQRAGAEGEEAGQRADEVGELAEQPRTLAGGLAAAAQVEGLEVAEAAVDDAEAGAAGGAAEVGPLEEEGGQAAAGGLQCAAGAVEAAADDDDAVLGAGGVGDVAAEQAGHAAASCMRACRSARARRRASCERTKEASGSRRP